ncbi:MAG: ATP--guanido phosphotransferase, partial [Ruminococcus sp.]|nr:ATP--guanido phosphotransferase [Ruminococcus sp.]
MSIVISTRVRLARNLKDYPFPRKLSEQGREKIVESVRRAVTDSRSAIADDFHFIRISDLEPL